MKGTDRVFFMTYRNMLAIRLCLVVVLLLYVDRISGKPLFDFGLLCYLACDDDDDVSTSSTTTTSSEYDWWDCDCRPRRRRTTTARPSANLPFNMSFGNGSGINMTMSQLGQTYFMSFVPVMPPAAGFAPVTPVPPGPTAAPGATTAAPGATTAATTAAG